MAMLSVGFRKRCCLLLWVVLVMVCGRTLAFLRFCGNRMSVEQLSRCNHRFSKSLLMRKQKEGVNLSRKINNSNDAYEGVENEIEFSASHRDVVADLSKMDPREMLSLKLQQWKVLAQSGALDKLAKTVTLSADDIEAFDVSANMILREKGVPLILNPCEQKEDNSDEGLMLKKIKLLEAKFNSLNKKDELVLFNMFLEIRDQKVNILSYPEGFQLFMKLLDAFVKLPTLSKDSLCIKSWYSKFQKILQSCVQWIDNDDDSESPVILADVSLLEDVEYWESLTRKLAQSVPFSQPNIFRETLSYLLEHDLVREENLSISKFIWQLRELVSNEDDNNSDKNESQMSDTETLSSLFDSIVDGLGAFSISGVNELIKYLGLMGLRDEMFAIYQRMESLSTVQTDNSNFENDNYYPHLRPNAETIEMLVTGLLLPVQEEHSSLSMKNLPSIVVNEKSNLKDEKALPQPQYIPEVILMGRSNVGKSSLTNLLLNRKNLAPVSAIPGFTQAFHFLTLATRGVSAWNKRLLSRPGHRNTLEKKETGGKLLLLPQKSQTFRVVDMPGLGFAQNVTSDKQSSWKSLLQRYLLKRETVKSVLHLIDIRHSLTSTDKEILSLVHNTAMERQLSNLQMFHYVVVLTKEDKCKTLREISVSKMTRAKEIQEFLQVINLPKGNIVTDTTAPQQMNMTKYTPILEPVFVSTSSLNKRGVDKLWFQILQHMQI